MILRTVSGVSDEVRVITVSEFNCVSQRCHTYEERTRLFFFRFANFWQIKLGYSIFELAFRWFGWATPVVTRGGVPIKKIIPLMWYFRNHWLTQLNSLTVITRTSSDTPETILKFMLFCFFRVLILFSCFASLRSSICLLGLCTVWCLSEDFNLPSWANR